MTPEQIMADLKVVLDAHTRKPTTKRVYTSGMRTYLQLCDELDVDYMDHRPETIMNLVEVWFARGQVYDTIKGRLNAGRLLWPDFAQALDTPEARIRMRRLKRLHWKKRKPALMLNNARLETLYKGLDLSNYRHLRLFLFLQLSYETGQRSATILKIKHEDISACDEEGWSELQMYDAKNFDQADCPLSPFLNAVIRRWRHHTKCYEGFMFARPISRARLEFDTELALTYNTMLVDLKLFAPHGYTLHSTRKGRFIDMINTEGASTVDVMHAMNVKSIQTVHDYTKQNPMRHRAHKLSAIKQGRDLNLKNKKVRKRREEKPEELSDQEFRIRCNRLQLLLPDERTEAAGPQT